MAKNKKKVVDLKPTIITDEELGKIQELVGFIQKGEMQLGQLEVQKHTVLHRIVAIQESIGALQKDFEKTYGKVDINITDGSITYTEDEQADKKD